MFKYFGKLLEDTKIYAYNYFNRDASDADRPTRIYPPLQPAIPTIQELCEASMADECLGKENDSVQSENIVIIDDKKLRIDTLLFVRQYKNTYYKYTKKEKFNQELYNSFVNDENFDGGLTGFDEDDNVRIFDKYVIEYIKNRNDVVTFLQCKNKEVVLREKLNQLQNVDASLPTIDVLFTIDMNEKDMFNYCYNIVAKNGNISIIKHIIFSLIIKYNGEYIRMKLSAFTPAEKKNETKN
jgi:hypothetical protein